MPRVSSYDLARRNGDERGDERVRFSYNCKGGSVDKINAFLWFSDQAEEAASQYASLFGNSGVGRVVRYRGDAAKASGRFEGSVMTVAFRLEGEEFVALNGGPIFRFTPALSFFVNCATEDEVDRIWRGLSAGSRVLMELGEYPFSRKFGWIQDKYGLSWQLNFGPRSQKIAPFLLFVGKEHGRAEEAAGFYTSIFHDSAIRTIERFKRGEPGMEGTVKHMVFSLSGKEFMAMDSNLSHDFTFNEAVSFVVNCEDQEEIDYYWDRLSAGGDEKAQQCGWLKDKYGLSWQIVPTALAKMMNDKDPKRVVRVTEAFLKMKKFDINALKKAYEG